MSGCVCMSFVVPSMVRVPFILSTHVQLNCGSPLVHRCFTVASPLVHRSGWYVCIVLELSQSFLHTVGMLI